MDHTHKQPEKKIAFYTIVLNFIVKMRFICTFALLSSYGLTLDDFFAFLHFLL